MITVTVLGGSAAGPNPGAGCSGYLLDDGETAIVVDLGPGTYPELRRHIDPKSLAGVVISHAHLDHTLDLGTMRFALKYGPNKAAQPVRVWAPESANQMLAGLGAAYTTDEAPGRFFSGVLDILNYDPEAELSIGTFSTRFAATVHYVPTWAMRIASSRGGVVGYTADTGPAANLVQHLSGVDVLIAESTLSEPGDEPYETRGHLTAREAGELASACGAGRLVLTHIWEEIGYEKLWREAAAVFRGEILMARPGLRVTAGR